MSSPEINTISSYSARIEAMTEAARLNIAMHIERCAFNMQRKLRLDGDYPGLMRMWQHISETSPLFARSAVITGHLCQDVYDEHPGFAYYYVAATRSFSLPPYCVLPRAQDIALDILSQEREARDPQGDGRSGEFSPIGIILMDQFDKPIQEYRARNFNSRLCEGWQVEFACEQGALRLEEQALELERKSSYEAGWDNFETSRCLSEEAQRLRRQARISKVRPRVVM